MISFLEWQKNAYQIMFEGASFYFVRKMPIAFRPPSSFKNVSQKSIIIRDTQFGKEAQNFVETLETVIKSQKTVIHMAKPEIFSNLIEKAYRTSLFEGVKRISRERLNGNWNPDDQIENFQNEI